MRVLFWKRSSIATARVNSEWLPAEFGERDARDVMRCIGICRVFGGLRRIFGRDGKWIAALRAHGLKMGLH